MVDRFTITAAEQDPWIDADPSGQWVRYSDYAALEAQLAAAPNSGRVTAEMLEAAARAILKAEWEIAGEIPEDAAWIADAIIDGITDDCEDDALAARMAARAAFEAIGLMVEG